MREWLSPNGVGRERLEAILSDSESGATVIKLLMGNTPKDYLEVARALIATIEEATPWLSDAIGARDRMNCWDCLQK